MFVFVVSSDVVEVRDTLFVLNVSLDVVPQRYRGE